MTNTTKFLVAALVAAVGCSTGSQNTQEPKPAVRADVQQPTQVASYEARADRKPHAGHDEHHARKHKADPSSAIGQGQMLLKKGKLDEAAAHFEKLTVAEPDNAKAWMLYGYALHGAGNLDKALEIHKKAATFEKVAPVALYNVACVHSLKGDADAAFAALDQAVAAGFDKAGHLDKDEDLANVRGDARFPALRKSVEANAARHKTHDKAECDAKSGEHAI